MILLTHLHDPIRIACDQVICSGIWIIFFEYISLEKKYAN